MFLAINLGVYVRIINKLRKMNRFFVKPLVIMMSSAVKPTTFAPIVTISKSNLNYMFATIKDQTKTNTSSENQKQGQSSNYQKDQKDSTQKSTDKTVKPDQKLSDTQDKKDLNKDKKDQKDQTPNVDKKDWDKKEQNIDKKEWDTKDSNKDKNDWQKKDQEKGKIDQEKEKKNVDPKSQNTGKNLDTQTQNTDKKDWQNKEPSKENKPSQGQNQEKNKTTMSQEMDQKKGNEKDQYKTANQNLDWQSGKQDKVKQDLDKGTAELKKKDPAYNSHLKSAEKDAESKKRQKQINDSDWGKNPEKQPMYQEQFRKKQQHRDQKYFNDPEGSKYSKVDILLSKDQNKQQDPKKLDPLGQKKGPDSKSTKIY